MIGSQVETIIFPIVTFCSTLNGILGMSFSALSLSCFYYNSSKPLPLHQPRFSVPSCRVVQSFKSDLGNFKVYWCPSPIWDQSQDFWSWGWNQCLFFKAAQMFLVHSQGWDLDPRTGRGWQVFQILQCEASIRKMRFSWQPHLREYLWTSHFLFCVFTKCRTAKRREK